MKTIDEPKLESDLGYRFAYLTEFMGFGEDGMTEVPYRLTMLGNFDSAWRPQAIGDTTTVSLAAWEMKPDNNRQKNISCSASGSDPFAAEIGVTRTN